MTLPPLWRNRLITVGAAALALWLGAKLAEQAYFWPILITGTLSLLSLRRLLALPVEGLLLGLALFGYLAGNRGFAQISLAGNFPLLPAEFVLLIGGLILGMQSAFGRRGIVQRDALNLAIAIWIGVGSVRLGFDLKAYGFSAMRDFALVYYAAFFFLAQYAARDDRTERWLQGCLLAGFAAMLVLYPLVDHFADFFLSTLTLRGSPLIFFKGDLVGTMLMAGGVLVYMRLESYHRPLATVASLVLIGAGLTTNNRASLVGLFTVTLLLLLGRRWKFAATQATAAVVAGIAILFIAHLTNLSWRQTPLFGVYERVASLTDPLGQQRYSGEDTYNKGDNNRFRAVWWRTVFDETIAGNPVFGLGFGTDLAAGFIREYYPEQSDEFDARSPHNVMLTTFGRTGIVGLVPLLLISGLLAQRVIGAARSGKPTSGLWCAAWVILVSACFGVVLEGPMGAVMFWSILGLAHGRDSLNSQSDITVTPPLHAGPGTASA